MKLPIKISPDNIKDSIIEIKYESILPYEVMVGYIFESLDNSYKYTNHPQQFRGNLPNEITFNLGVQNLFFTEKIKLQLQPNALIFNCIDKYFGWDEYKIEIENALSQIITIKEIQKFTRIGVRYISEYPETEITNCTKFNFTFGIPQIKSDTFVFRTEFNWDKHRVVLNLQHLTPTLTSKQNIPNLEVKSISTIDIDIISENLNIKNIDDLLKKIEESHTIEKEVFFNLLSPSYLESLTPIYE